MTALLVHLNNMVTYHYIMLLGPASNIGANPTAADVKTKCGVANQLKTALVDVVGEFKGVALLFASVAGVLILGGLIFLAFTKHATGLIKGLAIIIVAAALLGAGVTFVSSPC